MTQQDPVTLNGTVSSSRDLVVGMIFLHQTAVGFLGNCLLLYYYSFSCCTSGSVRSTDLIVQHLTVANFLVILSKGVPQTMAALGMKHFLSDTGCKLVFYVHRVGRAMCVGSTCFLSIFQAISISPVTSRWKPVRGQAPRCMKTNNTLILCWILNMLAYIFVPMHVTGKPNHTEKMEFGYCGAARKRLTYPLHLILWSSYDVLCLGLMVWSSGSMVFLLCRHKHRVQHIHSTDHSFRSSPEVRITQGILALVSTFVLSYLLSSVFSLILAFYSSPGLWLVNTSALMAACFPTTSPFLLMFGNPRISTLICVCCEKNAHSSKLIK